MIFSFEERLSDSPFIERVWRTESERAGAFTSIAASHWEIVVTRHEGRMSLAVRGPETKATSVDCSIQAEWFGIIFKTGSFMPHLLVRNLVDSSAEMPATTNNSFWLHDAAWQYPTYENADTFVARLVRAGLLVHDPVIGAVLHNRPQGLSPRTLQRRFVRATGLTHGALRQIERARQATTLLQQGLSILDTVEQAGYADQAHLTRSLRRFVGKTPTQLIQKTEQMSLLFKTTSLP